MSFFFFFFFFFNKIRVSNWQETDTKSLAIKAGLAVLNDLDELCLQTIGLPIFATLTSNFGAKLKM